MRPWLEFGSVGKRVFVVLALWFAGASVGEAAPGSPRIGSLILQRVELKAGGGTVCLLLGLRGRAPIESCVLGVHGGGIRFPGGPSWSARLSGPELDEAKKVCGSFDELPDTCEVSAQVVFVDRSRDEYRWRCLLGAGPFGRDTSTAEMMIANTVS